MTTLRYGNDETTCNVAYIPDLSGKIRIHVRPDGRVDVEAPAGSDDARIHAALYKRARWIFRHIEASREARAYALPRTYVSGETHFYLGRRYQLKVIETRRQPSAVKLIGARIEVVAPRADPTAIRRRLHAWYRLRAADYFKRRLFEVAGRLDWIEAVPDLKLVRMESQWGSCSPTGNININPWLIRAPRHCIDYVLTHELCHLKEHNHSRSFYVLLDRYCPNWQTTKSELDRLAELLLADHALVAV
jgi:predicted metal-dependent hydrolase